MDSHSSNANQTASSVEHNSRFFRENIGSYSADISVLDSYSTIRASVNEAVQGITRLLDIGNGGVFDYDTSLVGNIVALDLFLDGLPTTYVRPPRVTLKQGTALDITEPSESFDGVLMIMLLHHLVGASVRESMANMGRAISEAYRVLSPGGRLIIVESCVPSWFYSIERAVFPIAVPMIEKLLPHPATLQYPHSVLCGIIRNVTGAVVNTTPIPAGRWLLQFGYKFPSALTPARPYRFVVRKPDAGF